MIFCHVVHCPAALQATSSVFNDEPLVGPLTRRSWVFRWLVPPVKNHSSNHPSPFDHFQHQRVNPSGPESASDDAMGRALAPQLHLRDSIGAFGSRMLLVLLVGGFGSHPLWPVK